MSTPPEDLAARLAPFSLAMLEKHKDAAYSIDESGRVFYVNPAWDVFATANGGGPALRAEQVSGVDLFAVIPPPLRPFYVSLFEVAAAHAADPKRGPIQHVYECSSEAQYRSFQMSLYPLREAGGVLIVNVRVQERPHNDATRPVCAPEDCHLDADGLVHQCCHCRRVRNVAHPGRWDWVPAWVKQIPKFTSHTICEPCFDFYYSDAPMPD